MVFDRTENEPDEWDPEEEYYDSESDGLTIPQVTGDDGPDDLDDLSSATEPPAVEMGETDASADLLQTFWALVLVSNAAVLAGSLGLLFLLFGGVTTHAVALLVAGFVLVGFAVRRYRRFRDDESGTGDGGSDTDLPPPSTDDGSETETERSTDDAAETTSGSVTQQQSPNRDDRA